MVIKNFFRINLPFGLRRNKNNEWAAFNREYLPIGYNSCVGMNMLDESSLKELHIFTKYVGITEQILFEVATPDRIIRDAVGCIKAIYLYNEETFPLDNDTNWEAYCDRIQKLAVLNVPSPKSKLKTFMLPIDK